MPTGDNNLKIEIVQTEKDRVLSRLTLEYPEMPNQMANAAQVVYVDSMLDAAAKLDAFKNGPALVEGMKQLRGKKDD